MPKLFTEEIIPAEQEFCTLTQEHFHYLSHVLRIKKGERVVLGDAVGMDHTGIVVEIRSDRIDVQWVSHAKNKAEPPYDAVLYQGLLKGEKMDWVIQKSVELGVSRVVPLSSERVITRMDERDCRKKIVRWEKIAFEAARQSGRGIVPQIDPPHSFTEAVMNLQKTDSYSFLLWEEERERTIHDFLERRTVDRSPHKTKPVVSFLVGPEGGFSEEEITLAKECDIETITLGHRILRAETAGLAVLSVLSYRFELF